MIKYKINRNGCCTHLNGAMMSNKEVTALLTTDTQEVYEQGYAAGNIVGALIGWIGALMGVAGAILWGDSIAKVVSEAMSWLY